jgi:hypothetical protein
MIGRTETLGIADAVRAKTVLWRGGSAAEAVARGQAELCTRERFAAAGLD